MVDRHAGRVVIVGAGQAGARCAEALRALGHAGPITLLGEEPQWPYERPPLSKSFLAGTSALDAARVLAPGWYAEHEVGLRLNDRVSAIDSHRHHISLASGDTLPYDALVLATGARPRALGQGTAVLRNAADAAALRERLKSANRLVIVGAGFIGLEVACVARGMGVQVMLLEAAATPMARVVPADIGRWFVALHETHGVQWRLKARIDSVSGSAVQLAGGETLHADVVLAAIGILPNDELAREAGIACEDGILVDAFGRTSDPDVYAIGDCARLAHGLSPRPIRLECWQHADAHAQAVARTIVGQPEPYAEIPWAWSDQYDVNLQVCGWPDAQGTAVWRGDLAQGGATLFLVQALQNGGVSVRAAVSVNRPRDQRAARRLIAAGTGVDPGALADPAARLV